ncbi:MAG: glycosyltransferase [Verrucomicrobiota bacterium]|nr:glycosyltransferase [Verrucomicrobiota bacterium]
MQFSVVVPAYNAEAFVGPCLESVFGQSLSPEDFEVILVDDCSTDSTLEVASRFARQRGNMIVTRTARNQGPGIARNIGLSRASGRWVLFVDSDDWLAPQALETLQAFLAARGAAPVDVVVFNWAHCSSVDLHDPARSATGRRDHASFALQKRELIKRYLSLRMDGSVIYAAIRRSLIVRNKVRFAMGFHEDVDYLFKVYWHARGIRYLPEILYLKRRRDGSIVGTISEAHIRGFMRAWKEIRQSLTDRVHGDLGEFPRFYQTGLTGVLATRVREIYRLSRSAEEAAVLYATLYRGYQEFNREPEGLAGCALRTKYQMIAEHFLKVMGDSRLDCAGKGKAIKEHMDEVITKSWSCSDLHGSLFLAPTQIRACCKRFFVDGRMRGDVCLLDTNNSGSGQFVARNILEAKQRLLDRINSGEPTGCEGCPFLEFKDWGPVRRVDVRYLSLEYHSVCNLRCSYCSEVYYGGVGAQYDVGALIDDLLEEKALDNCGLVVLGGGEPVLDGRFKYLVRRLSAALPHAHQRVFTNAVVFSETVHQLLCEGRGSVVTSLDAGTEDTYARVHGRRRLTDCLANLERYAAANAGQVTIKYVFIEANSSLDEVMAFGALLRRRRLAGCNIQISYDFKKETVPVDVVTAMIVLYGLACDAGFRVVYLDDLARARLWEIREDEGRVIESKLAELNLTHAWANPADCEAVAIWGAGWQAKHLIERSAFFKRVKIAFLVDDTPSKIGGRFLGHNILSPAALLESGIPVVIAAVQAFPAICGAFRALGLDESRLVRGLIL